MPALTYYVDPASFGIDVDSFDQLDHHQNAMMLYRLTEYVKDMSIGRGDLITIQKAEDRVRNENLFIYDGSRVVSLDYDESDIGHLPRFCAVGGEDGFDPHYWLGALPENDGLFWLSDSVLEQLVFAAVDGILTASVAIKDRVWTIVIDEDGADELPIAEVLEDVRRGRFFCELRPYNITDIDVPDDLAESPYIFLRRCIGDQYSCQDMYLD